MLSICSPVPTSSGEAGLERTVHLSFPQSLDVYCGLSLPPPPPGKCIRPLPGVGGTETSHSAFLICPEMQPRHGPTSSLGTGPGQPMVEVRHGGQVLDATQGS